MIVEPSGDHSGEFWPPFRATAPELFDRAEPGLARMHYDLSMNV